MSAPFRSLPSAAVIEAAMPDGAVLPVYRMAGPAGAPPLLFGHANGMAAGSYEPWLRMLAERTEVFAFDARGHGGSIWPEGAIATVFAVDRIADDLLHLTRAVAAATGAQELAFVGHSLGAAAALRLLALGRAPQWRVVVAFEPPIFPPPGTAAHAEAVEKQRRLVEGTLKRREHWASPEALAERLKGRGMFARFEPAMLAAHCRATLRPDDGGGFRLCCPPAVESFIFKSQSEADTWHRLGLIARDVTLVGGDAAIPDNDWVSSALPEMAAVMPRARFVPMRCTGHLLISEQPRRCAELVWDALRA
ncbi:MAG TPA: alpha/beta hydrolase [Stellaceae bacterium]|nr:alpha/beta hydrolase [Stellaceae bacterium]